MDSPRCGAASVRVSPSASSLQSEPETSSTCSQAALSLLRQPRLAQAFEHDRIRVCARDRFDSEFGWREFRRCRVSQTLPNALFLLVFSYVTGCVALVFESEFQCACQKPFSPNVSAAWPARRLAVAAIFNQSQQLPDGLQARHFRQRRHAHRLSRRCARRQIRSLMAHCANDWTSESNKAMS